MYKILPLLSALLLLVQKIDAQIDTVPPELVCKNFPWIQLSDFCFGNVNVQELVDTVYDDSQYYELAFRKVCTGDGFPSTKELTFLESESLSKVELWARDSAGNTSTCEMRLYFHDSGFCDFGSSLDFFTSDGDGIDSVVTHVMGENCLHDSIDYQIAMTGIIFSSGWYSWMPGSWISYGGFAPVTGYNYDILPSRNNDPLNGVTTYDLVLISKHILGLEPFDSPLKMIAADVNMDGKVTTYDIFIARKLILGIITELPHAKSWRFIPHDYIFPVPQNPFEPSIPDRITVPRSTEFPYGSYKFSGIKIGDVDFSADPN
ncbi:MAG: dockerin type I domain-containing protein [Saprospiraceae bacterium]